LFIAMFFSSFLLLAKIPVSFMPDILNRYAEVFVELEPGVAPEERTEIAFKMNEALEKTPDIADNIVLDDLNGLFAIINMTPEDEKTMEQNEVNEKILENLRAREDAYSIRSVAAAMAGAVSPPSELRASGGDLTTMHELAEDVVKGLAAFPDISSDAMHVGDTADEHIIQLAEQKMNDDQIAAPH